MATEKEENYYETSEVIEQFHSPVVESIALLSALVNPSQHDFATNNVIQLIKELPAESKEFIQDWQKLTNSDFVELFNLFLPVPYFTDVSQFVEKLNLITNEEFLFHFFGEEISFSQIEVLINNPIAIDFFEPHILWETAEHRSFIKEFVTNMQSYRMKISNLLLDISNSSALQVSIEENKETIEDSLLEIKSLAMEPLNLAQYIMGKSFKRTSLYKMYYFVPSYFFTPHRIRIFNKDICIVIYGCVNPLSDARESSADLELKLKALSDRNRLLILSMLSGKKEYGARLAEYLGITTATVSHHLEILKRAGFILEEKVGNIKYFTCDLDTTANMLEKLSNFILKDKL